MAVLICPKCVAKQEGKTMAEQSVDKWKFVCQTDNGDGYILTTRILPVLSAPGAAVGCLVHTSTERNRANGPLLSEALTFVPDVGIEHFGL